MFVCALQSIHDDILDITFLADMESALKLLQPVQELLQSMSKDKPLLSQLMPIWQSTFTHAKKWAADAMADDSQLLTVLRIRFNKCVHPAMYVAYLLDPVSWVPNEEDSGYIPNMSKVAAMNTLFGIDMVKAAKEVNWLPSLPLHLHIHANACHHAEIASNSVAANAHFIRLSSNSICCLSSNSMSSIITACTFEQC